MEKVCKATSSLPPVNLNSSRVHINELLNNVGNKVAPPVYFVVGKVRKLTEV